MKVNVNLHNKSLKAKVPAKVAKALDFHKTMGLNMNPADVDLALMAIPFSDVKGPSLILKEFARETPTTYLQAIANGYEPTLDLREEVAKMLTDWLNEEYGDDEQADIEKFAKLVTDYIRRQI